MLSVFSSVRALLTKTEIYKASFLFLLMCIGMLLETMSIGLVVPFIGLMMQDGLIDKYPTIAPVLSYFGNPNQIQIIIGAMAFLVFIYLVKTAFLAFSIWKQTSFAYQLQHRVSDQLFKTYLTKPYTFHLTKNSADLIRNATTEVTLFTLVINALILLTTEILVLIGIAAILVYIEPVGAIVVISCLTITGFLFNKLTKSKILHWGKARQHHDGLRIQHLQQGLGGVKEVKLYGREKDFIDQFSKHNYESARSQGNQVMIQQFPRLILEFLAIMGLAILVFIMILSGSNLAGVIPVLGLFAAAAFRLMPSANRLIGAIQSIRFNGPVISVLNQELTVNDLKPKKTKMHSQNNYESFKNKIQLEQVSYAYDDSKEMALKDINLTIKKGDTIGVIGSSGSGKSTLIDIVLGLFIPTEGHLSIDGHKLGCNTKAWQAKVGYVPQSIYLTDDSLKRNIALGLPVNAIDDESINRAIDSAQLTNFIHQLPDGVETVVGEQGVRLSGGQRQRIGIARALYHNPDVLVLDEATSALDSETEHDVMDSIHALHGSKTIIIVAHRLSTVEKCDKLFQLDAGKLVASGPPKELLNKYLETQSLQ